MRTGRVAAPGAEDEVGRIARDDARTGQPADHRCRECRGLGLYRLDINFRESAVVGIVGGGGIGATLNTAFDRYEFDSAAAILLIIIAIVMLMEYSSGYLRRWVQ